MNKPSDPNQSIDASLPRAQMLFAGFGMVALLLLLVMLGSVAALQDKNENTSLHATVAAISALGAVGALLVCSRFNRSIRAHSHQKQQQQFKVVDKAIDKAVATTPGTDRALAVAALTQLPFTEVLPELVLRVRDIVIDDEPTSILAAARYTPPSKLRGLVLASGEESLQELLETIPLGSPEETIAELVDLIAALETGLE